jgi:hypothetical protein
MKNTKTEILEQNQIKHKKIKNTKNIWMNPATWTQIQTRFHEINSIQRLQIIQGSRINGSFTLIFFKSSWFDQNGFQLKTKTLRLKIIINMLLMQINTIFLVIHA